MLVISRDQDIENFVLQQVALAVIDTMKIINDALLEFKKMMSSWMKDTKK